MKKSFLLISLILLIGMAYSLEYGPTGMGVPAEAQARAAMIPATIPQEIIDAGAEAEYLAVTCAMARYNMQRFVDGADTVKAVWDEVAASLNSEGITMDTSALSSIKLGVLSRVDALCSATQETYGAAIQEIISFSIGGNGLEQSLKSIGTKLESDIKARMDEYTAEGAEIQAQIDAMTGGKTLQEIEAIVSQIQAKSAQYQAIVNSNPMTAQDSSAQALLSEIQSLQASLGASTPAAQKEAIALGEQAKEFGEKAQSLGLKIEGIFSGISVKMKAAFAEKDYSELKAAVNQHYYNLFLKVFDAKVFDIETKKAEVSSYGIDTSMFDEVTAWAANKKEEAKGVFTADAKEDDIKAFIELINLESIEMEIRINRVIEELIREKYIDGLEALRAQAGAGIDAAKNGGLDTTILENLTAHLEALRDEAIVLNEAGDDEASFAKIKEAEAIVELIKTEYTKLQAQGERIETDARAVITSLNSQKEKILALKEAARRVELDTTILEALEAELYALEEEANSLLSQGKNAEALLKIDEAKAKFEALKVEYSRLLIGVKSI